MKILITNVASVTAISILKVLKKGKISDLLIFGTEAQQYGYNSGSMLVDHYIQVPQVSSSSYAKVIQEICQYNGIDAIIPILDEELYLFTTNEIYKYTRLVLPDIQTIKLFRDKELASYEIKNLYLGLVPNIYKNYDSINCDKVIIRKNKGIGSQGIIIKYKKDVSKADFNHQDCFVQEYIEGIEYTVDVLADNNGKVKLIIPRKRLQIKNGISTKVEITQDKDIIDFCEKIYNKYYIPGLSNVQFIKQDNNAYFLELNMRFAAMGIASILASYDYISDYICHLIDNKDLGEYLNNMRKVKWKTVVCRYYEETVLMQ